MSAPTNGNAVDYFVDRHLREGRGDIVAFRDPWRGLSYAGLAEATHRFAGALREAGVERERRIVLLLLDTVDFPMAFWGALRAGVVPVPINPLLTARDGRLCPGGQPRRCGGDLGAAGRRRCCRCCTA